MSGGDDEDKTEDPSQRKLSDARKKGQVPLSREANSWLMLFSGSMLVLYLLPSMMEDLTAHLRSYLEFAHVWPAPPGGIRTVLGDSFLRILQILAAPLILLIAAALIGPLGQVGFLISYEKIQPDFSKISLIKGWGRLFSMRSFVEFLKGLAKITLIAIVAIALLRPYFDKIDHMVGLEIPDMLHEIYFLNKKLLNGVLAALFFLALADFTYQRIEHTKSLRMSKQEVKDEYKQSEGDPHIKARLRQLRSEKSRQRMMQSVPQADVIITNPTHYAIALKYDPNGMDAPICVAKGLDFVAQKIKEIATEHKIIMVENKPLARSLYDTVEIDKEIPIEHYKAVAEIISYVFKMRNKR
jgi:flagellar biosynthetic protein FlhB